MPNRALLEAVPDPMTRRSADGTILEFKSAKWVETPAPPAEIVAKNASDVLPPEAAARVMHHIGRAQETGEAQRYHAQVPGPAKAPVRFGRSSPGRTKPC